MTTGHWISPKAINPPTTTRHNAFATGISTSGARRRSAASFRSRVSRQVAGPVLCHACRERNRQAPDGRLRPRRHLRDSSGMCRTWLNALRRWCRLQLALFNSCQSGETSAICPSQSPCANLSHTTSLANHTLFPSHSTRQPSRPRRWSRRPRCSPRSAPS